MLRLTNKKMTKANVWTDTLAFIFFEGAAFGEVFTFGFSWACCARWGSTRFLHSDLIGRAAHAGFLR